MCARHAYILTLYHIWYGMVLACLHVVYSILIRGNDLTHLDHDLPAIIVLQGIQVIHLIVIVIVIRGKQG